MMIMKKENLKAAHDLYEEVAPLKEARCLLSRDGCKIVVTGVGSEGAEIGLELPKELVRAHLLAALNREIERIYKLVEKLE